MFEEFLNHRCSIYHPEQVETKTKYGIKAAQSETCKATPDLEDVPCHFYVNSSLAIKQNEPFASIEGEAKLALPYGTDIRENDFVKSRGYMFRAGIPKAVHGNHHIVVTIRREDGIKGGDLMIDASQLEAFARKVEAASADLKPYMGKTLQEVGEEFLTIVQEAIEGAGNVDTGKLLSSFTKGGSGNVWNLDLGGLALEIGSTLDYAKYVNDGHRQQPGRFVPGYWEGNHFRYSPGAKSGMVLKASFVAGSHFFDRSVQTLERMFPEMADKAFEQFFRRYFG